jgi:hypothetical protein
MWNNNAPLPYHIKQNNDYPLPHRQDGMPLPPPYHAEQQHTTATIYGGKTLLLFTASNSGFLHG